MIQPLLSFVNFRLYHSINLKYPPILDPRLEALAAGTIFLNSNGTSEICFSALCIWWLNIFSNHADLYALSRYASANTRPSVLNSEASQAESEQVETKQKEAETGNETSELRLAQLQHQLPSNEPGALMHLVEEVTGEDEEDQDTKDCKKLFKNMKFFVSREVRPFDFLAPLF